ncbi:MAG: hypothetical protein ABIF01_01145 [Candidatus Micrarchaeota archaeon]
MGVREKKGFFFGIAIALLAIAMLISLALWTSAQGMKESRNAERFKAISLKEISESVSEDRLSAIIKETGRKAFYYVDWETRISGKFSPGLEQQLLEMLAHGRCRPVDTDRDGTSDMGGQEFLSLARECISKEGTGDCREFDVNSDGVVDQADSECFEREGESGDSLKAYAEKIKKIAGEQGFSFSLSPTSLKAEQNNPWNVNLHTTFDVKVADFGERTGISLEKNVENEISILGLPDPLSKTNRPIVRANENPRIKNLTKAIDDNARGEGWAYGKLASLNEVGTVDKKHILRVSEVTEYVANIADRYAGVIAEKPPTVKVDKAQEIVSTGTCTVICEYEIYEEISNCLNCMRWTSAQCGTGSQVLGSMSCPSLSPPKTLELTGKNIVSVPYLMGVLFESSSSILFDSGRNETLKPLEQNKNAAQASVFEIGGIRNIVLCGTYTENNEAPDFLQRLKGEIYSKSENGIESYLSPEPGKKLASPASMVDHMYYREDKTPGYAIRGMPGCTTQDECRKNWPTVFALDYGHIEKYDLGGIVCGNTTAPC